VPTDPSSAYSTVPDTSSDQRPIYSYEHKKIITDWSAFDFFRRINLGFAVGTIKDYEIDLNTNIGTFNLWITSIVL
jgi:hypothetical protein